LGFTIIHYVNNDVIVKHHVVIMFCQIKWSSRYRLVHDLCDSFLWQKHRPLATARATKSAISPVHWFPVSYGHTTRKISTCCACLSNVNDKSYKQSALHIFSLSPWSNLIRFWVNLTLSRWLTIASWSSPLTFVCGLYGSFSMGKPRKSASAQFGISNISNIH